MPLLEACPSPAPVEQRTPSPYAFRVQANIPADVARVFYAVVLDEYLEMWAGTSETPIRCSTEPRCGGRLQLECPGADGRPVTLTGTITRLETGSMATCMVSEEHSPHTPHCLVLTLHPHAGGTRVELLQMGLGESAHARYVEQLWQLAFDRLSSFFIHADAARRAL